MKSKAPLMLMEQMVLILVFAFAAVVCLQIFVKSDEISLQSKKRDSAVILVQSAAEEIKAAGGDFLLAAERMGAAQDKDGTLYLSYDENCVLTDIDENRAYSVCANELDSGIYGLGKARVCAKDSKNGEELFAVEIMWQEASAHE